MSQASIAAQLAAAELASDSAKLDAELLLADLLGVSRTYLATWPERELSATEQAAYRERLARRRGGEPVAYILGEQGFWTLQLACDPSTLIPRPETELLVEQALSLALPGRAEVVDLGTGSGAIALALASERPAWQLLAVDAAASAVALAERNRARYRLDNVTLLVSDWFAALGDRRFDLIVSNPPYIDSGDPHLSQGDLCFEPLSALVAGADGLDDLRRIVGAAPNHLNTGGWLLVEHGYRQAEAVAELFAAAGFAGVAGCRDLNGEPRTTLGQWR